MEIATKRFQPSDSPQEITTGLGGKAMIYNSSNFDVYVGLSASMTTDDSFLVEKGKALSVGLALDAPIYVLVVPGKYMPATISYAVTDGNEAEPKLF